MRDHMPCTQGKLKILGGFLTPAFGGFKAWKPGKTGLDLHRFKNLEVTLAAYGKITAAGPEEHGLVEELKFRLALRALDDFRQETGVFINHQRKRQTR